jgi:hypothetical protein
MSWPLSDGFAGLVAGVTNSNGSAEVVLEDVPGFIDDRVVASDAESEPSDEESISSAVDVLVDSGP